MKRILLSAAGLAAGLAALPADAQNLPPAYREQHRHEDQQRRPVPGDPTTAIRQRTDQVTNEIDYLMEHLEEHLEEGHADRGMHELFARADDALREGIHFRRSLRPGTQPREIHEHFQVFDRQIHDLVQATQQSRDPVLRRAASRLSFADEQLHAAVASASGRTDSAFIARQAHVLAAEAQRLHRTAEAVIAQQDHHEGGDHHGDPQLLEALHAYVDVVEHFHETAEHEDDRDHVVEDFAIVDRSWQRVADQIGRNAHGAYLYRRAERVGAMHDQLRQVIGAPGQRRTIRFNIGGIGIDLQR